MQIVAPNVRKPSEKSSKR